MPKTAAKPTAMLVKASGNNVYAQLIARMRSPMNKHS